ncbi:MAG: hypothetical protein ABI347_07270 [Nitrososphaera sp.]|jgi:hypothetical protein
MSSLLDKINGAKRTVFWTAPRELFPLHRLITRKKKELSSCKEYDRKLLLCAELESLCELKLAILASKKAGR